jgi:hypothetical protein
MSPPQFDNLPNMIKPNTDPNTAGEGTAEVVVATPEVDAGQSNGSDTSADNEEGTPETTTPAPEAIQTAPGADTSQPAEPAADEDDEPLAGDDGEKKFTQTEVNKMISERLKKKTGKLTTEFTTRETGLKEAVATLTTELQGYRNAAKESVQAEFDALPQEVRELAPASLETAEGVAAIKSWIPKAKTLADKLATPAPEVKPNRTPGNGDGPKPNGTTPAVDDAALIEKAKTHSIYSSF